MQNLVDATKAEAFAERIVGILNASGLGLMISIGHRTGLFDALEALPASSSEAIAARAGLDERYVREWLGAMVTGDIVEYDETLGHYSLPPEHAAALARSAAPENMAVTFQFLAVLAAVEDDIVECFKNGGGVPYERFPRFHTVMVEESNQTVLPALIEQILPLVPGISERLNEGIDVLDVGCGSGRALMTMAEAYPASRFTGFDLSTEAVTRARAEASARNITNVRFEERDVTELGLEATFDLVTAFDAIHDQANPANVLAGIKRALRPTGAFLMQDIHASSHVEKNRDHLIAPFLYTISCMHCMTVSLAQGGVGLGTCWGEELATDMLKEAGFSDVSCQMLEHDVMNSYFVAR